MQRESARALEAARGAEVLEDHERLLRGKAARKKKMKKN
jgi:hypothetical protein